MWKDETVDQNKYRQILVEEVVPAIIEKFPAHWLNEGVRIQQDGAESHIGPTGAEWKESTKVLKQEQGHTISPFTQPAQSPDANINGLAFFSSIQNLHCDASPKGALQLIENVEKAHEDCDPKKINRMWLTHQQCMNETLLLHGGSHHKLPHMGKEKLGRQGRLPKVLEVSEIAEELGHINIAEENTENNPANANTANPQSPSNNGTHLHCLRGWETPAFRHCGVWLVKGKV